MYLLGAVAVWLLLLAFLGLPVLLLGLWAWWLWQAVQRRRPRTSSPFDEAYARALDAIARRNGARAAERDLAELEA